MQYIYAIGLVGVVLGAIGVAGALAVQGLPIPDIIVNVIMAGLGALTGAAATKKLGG